MVNPLKVSSRSNPNSVAGALVAVIREQGYAEMQAVGAGALNQAVKAIAIATRVCCTKWSRSHMCTRIHRYRD